MTSAVVIGCVAVLALIGVVCWGLAVIARALIRSLENK